jgi:hypothetical protein
MPKPMFMLLTVEAVAFGPVFQRLKNMEGVVAINLDGEPDKPNGKPAPTPGGQERYLFERCLRAGPEQACEARQARLDLDREGQEVPRDVLQAFGGRIADVEHSDNGPLESNDGCSRKGPRPTRLA